MLKKNYRIIEKKQDNDMGANVAQQKRSNNKCYASAFRYIQMATALNVSIPQPSPRGSFDNRTMYETTMYS